MNKEFTRMQQLAGILTESTGPVYVPGSNPDIDDKSATMALDMMTKEGISGKMTKEEAKKKIKEAILAEVDIDLSNVSSAADQAYADMDNIDEAKKKKEDEEEIDIESDVEGDVNNLDLDLDTTDMGGDTDVDMNMDTTGDVDAGSSESKKAFSELTDAYRAAKELGDEKLIRQIANTITYFNKNIILKQG